MTQHGLPEWHLPDLSYVDKIPALLDNNAADGLLSLGVGSRGAVAAERAAEARGYTSPTADDIIRGRAAQPPPFWRRLFPGAMNDADNIPVVGGLVDLTTQLATPTNVALWRLGEGVGEVSPVAARLVNGAIGINTMDGGAHTLSDTLTHRPAGMTDAQYVNRLICGAAGIGLGATGLNGAFRSEPPVARSPQAGGPSRPSLYEAVQQANEAPPTANRLRVLREAIASGNPQRPTRATGLGYPSGPGTAFAPEAYSAAQAMIDSVSGASDPQGRSSESQDSLFNWRKKGSGPAKGVAGHGNASGNPATPNIQNNPQTGPAAGPSNQNAAPRRPVSAALRIPPGPEHEPLRQALGHIDRIHLDGNLPSIPAGSETNMPDGVLGIYRHSGRAPRNIGVSDVGQWSMLTMAHETGHFLDHAGIGTPGVYASLGDPIMDEWWDAIRASTAVRYAQSLMGKAAVNVVDGGGAVRTYPVDHDYVSYVLKPQELWARSYAQYVATTSGDADMLEQLDRCRSSLGSRVYGKQWSESDFEPIRQAIDNILKGQGWLMP